MRVSANLPCYGLIYSQFHQVSQVKGIFHKTEMFLHLQDLVFLSHKHRCSFPSHHCFPTREVSSNITERSYSRTCFHFVIMWGEGKAAAACSATTGDVRLWKKNLPPTAFTWIIPFPEMQPGQRVRRGARMRSGPRRSHWLSTSPGKAPSLRRPVRIHRSNRFAIGWGRRC